MRRPAPALPIEPAPSLSLALKGRHAPWTNSEQKRGCEEMRIHFFTAPSFVSFFTPGSKKQEEKGILPPFPQKPAF